MSRRLEVQDVLRTIVASARELLDAEYAALGVPDDHGGFAQFVVEGISEEQWRRIGPLPRQHGVLAATLHQDTAERLADVRQDPRFGGWPAAHPEMSDFLTNARLYERSRELTMAEERSRLAHELHDAVSQKLFSLRLTAQAAAALVDRDPARAKDELQQVALLAAEAADELRAAVTELRPAALDEDGLVATLRNHVRVLDRAHTAHATFTCDGVRALPATQDIEVVGEAGDGEEGIARAEELRPDVILMDVKMPGTDGIEALRRLRELANPARVLIVTSFTEQRTVVPALRAGAAGYVYKDIAPDALAAAIRSVHPDHVLLQPEVAEALLAQDDQPSSAGRPGTLTDREREVLSLIADGRSNREMARALVLSEKTVKTRVSNIPMKLDVSDRTQAALWAVRHGITE